MRAERILAASFSGPVDWSLRHFCAGKLIHSTRLPGLSFDQALICMSMRLKAHGKN